MSTSDYWRVSVISYSWRYKLHDYDWIRYRQRTTQCSKQETLTNVGFMLGQRRRRWPDITPTLGQRLDHFQNTTNVYLYETEGVSLLHHEHQITYYHDYIIIILDIGLYSIKTLAHIYFKNIITCNMRRAAIHPIKRYSIVDKLISKF